MADSLDYDGISEFMHSDEMRDYMQEVAEEVAATAKALAPKRTGRMASRIKASTEDGITGVNGKVTAPAPANLLSTAKGVRHQVTAWGHRVDLWHKADNAFLKRALYAETSVFDSEVI